MDKHSYEHAWQNYPERALRCPKCRRRITDVTLLEVRLQGHDVRLFLIRCSKGDYRAVATETRVNRALTEALFDHLKLSQLVGEGSL